MKSRFVFACAAMALAAAPCVAAASSWDGTWKLNEAKSNFAGETYVITDKGNGMMHSDDGSIAFDFACDGKAYPVMAGQTLTCTGSPTAGYEYVAKIDGKVTRKSHRTFSADGKTMTVHGMDIRPDGSTQDFTYVWKRDAGNSGLVGKWRNVKAQGNSDTMVIETKGNWIKVYDPAYKATMEGKMDGSELTVKGPAVMAGMSQRIKPEGPNKLHYTVAYNGKLITEGVQTLSGDGKTLVDVSWTPGKMNEKSTAVYERQ